MTCARKVLGIDPGTTDSGVVMYDAESLVVLDAWTGFDNDALLIKIRSDYFGADVCAIEDIEAMGFAVGNTTLITCKWVGRFQEAWENFSGVKAHIISRGDEKIMICGCKTYRNPKSGKVVGIKDPEIKAALKDRFPQTGGGKTPSVGTKKQPGPLFGVTKHAWSALAVVITLEEQIKNGIVEPSIYVRG